jgi:hypothetical protein
VDVELANNGSLIVFQTILWQLALPIIFTVSPFFENERSVKNTLSINSGMHSPPIPPFVSDQLILSFQIPVPPTQYKFREPV